MVRVHYDEGAAIHIGPESCAGGREAVREALTGECAGQPLSREKADIPGADAVRYAEGHTQAVDTVPVDIAFPGQKLIDRKRVKPARVLDPEPAAADSLDNSRLAPYCPPLPEP